MTGSPESDRSGARPVERDPSSEHVAPTAGAERSNEDALALLSEDDRNDYQRRWDDIQVRFVDEPEQSVREADDLVSEVTRQIADRFTSDRQQLEQRWEGGEPPTTEELRRTVQRYRDFFQRLIAGHHA